MMALNAAQLGSPSATLLCSDFDGTLAPIVADPALAAANPAAIEALARLARSLLLVSVISGRDAEFVASKLTGLNRVLILGNYGIERLRQGRPELMPGVEPWLEVMARFNHKALSLLEGSRDVALECKRASSTVHFRRAMDPNLARQLHQTEIQALAGSMGLESRMGRQAIEIFPPLANKGDAIRGLIQHHHPRTVIYIGDDTGDLPVFAALNQLELKHLSVGVASDESDRAIFGKCDLIVDDVDGVVSLLADLATWADPKGP